MTYPAPTVTDEALAEALGKNVTADALAEIKASAIDLLTQAFDGSWRTPSQSVANTCYLRVARSLRDEGKSVRGKGQLATVESGTGARGFADPLAPVRQIIAAYVVPL